MSAYFSNGSEGMDFQARWCDRCLHDKEYRDTGEGPGCAVWAVHILYNYEDKVSGVLDELIPRTKDRLSNEECRMFIPEKPPPVSVKGQGWIEAGAPLFSREVPRD